MSWGPVAVSTRTRGEHDSARARCCGRREQRCRALDIHAPIEFARSDTFDNRRSCRKVRDRINSCNRAFHRRRGLEAAFDHFDVAADAREIFPAARAEVVEHAHARAACEQRFAKMRADETRAARNKHERICATGNHASTPVANRAARISMAACTPRVHRTASIEGPPRCDACSGSCGT